MVVIGEQEEVDCFFECFSFARAAASVEYDAFITIVDQQGVQGVTNEVVNIGVLVEGFGFAH